MAQQTSPFLEGKFGWSLGESNWNLGMDENLLKFSYMFDKNIDGIVSSLPAVVNGTAYFNTTDNRIYFAVGGSYKSTPTPKWFIVTNRTSGQTYQFNGTALAAIDSPAIIAKKLGVTSIPEQFGGVGDGVVDDTAAVVAALATGNKVEGLPGKVYAVTGNITLPSTCVMQSIAFKQLSPDDVARRTLYQNAGTLCRLTKVVVDRNGTGAGGQIGNSAGIYISNCADARLESCEVFGNNFGDGITLTDSKAKLYNNYVHDMTFGTSSSAVVTDDVMQGFILVRCTGEAIGNRAERLKGQWTGQAVVHKFTRGIALAGCYDMSLLGNTSDTVDQGFDYSGGENNRRIVSTANHANNCYSWGHKAANTVTDSTYTGCIAYRCGLGGFVASAPTSILAVPSSTLTQNIIYTACLAIETGYGSNWTGSSIQAGFQALNSPSYVDFPRGIKWIGCRSYGGSLNQRGFKNDVPVSGTGEFYNEAINCDVKDATLVDFVGLNRGTMKLRTAAAQSLASTVAQVVTFGTVVDDRMNGGSTRIVRRSGDYLLSCTATFQSNANGSRRVQFFKNGAQIPTASWFFPPINGTDVTCNASIVTTLTKGDVIDVWVTQDSASTINLTSANFQITEQGAGQI